MLMTIAALCLLAGVVAAQPAGDRHRVAVLDFHNRAELDVNEIDYITDIVRISARQALPSSRYIVMTKDNILELLPPGTSLIDCVGECSVETGRMIGADFVVAGEVTTFGGELRIAYTLYSTASGDLISGDRVGAKDILGLEQPLDKSVKSIFDPLLNRTTSPPAQTPVTRPRTQPVVTQPTASRDNFGITPRKAPKFQYGPLGGIANVPDKSQTMLTFEIASYSTEEAFNVDGESVTLDTKREMGWLNSQVDMRMGGSAGLRLRVPRRLSYTLTAMDGSETEFTPDNASAFGDMVVGLWFAPERNSSRNRFITFYEMRLPTGKDFINIRDDAEDNVTATGSPGTSVRMGMGFDVDTGGALLSFGFAYLYNVPYTYEDTYYDSSMGYEYSEDVEVDPWDSVEFGGRIVFNNKGPLSFGLEASIYMEGVFSEEVADDLATESSSFIITPSVGFRPGGPESRFDLYLLAPIMTSGTNIHKTQSAVLGVRIGL
jgi:hypothetical protein